MKKCDSYCYAKNNLWLRNGTFYFIIETPRVNGKRRYKRTSLHTTNYFEAREKVKDMLVMTMPTTFFADLERLYKGLIFETESGQTFNVEHPFGTARLSKKNKVEDISQLLTLYSMLSANYEKVSEENKVLLNKVSKIETMLGNYIKSNKPAHHIKPIQTRTISEILESWLHKSQNGEKTESRKRNIISEFLSIAGLTLDNDYSKFHDIKIIESISKKIIEKDIKNNAKIKYMQALQNFVKCGHNFDPDNYKLNVIANLPKIAPTKKADLKPHIPYTTEQLLEIFNPKHSFFYENPDMFFTCMIALFTGARINGAATLQYNDIKVVEGIPCIEFIDNHPIKALKTDASERIVPIHPQLLDLGFVDYLKRKQERFNASGTDFIFPRCITTGNVYYGKYPRILFDFLTKIGIKTKTGEKLDFHSFRKNANMIMIQSGIPNPFIKRIIGWEGQDMSEGAYFNPTLTEIKSEVDKFSYDFLQPHFDEWKAIMAKK